MLVVMLTMLVVMLTMMTMSTAWDPCATLISPHLLHSHVRHKRQTPCVRATCGSSSVVQRDEDVKMCKLQNVWATGKGPLCEILLAVFRSQLKIEGQRFKWEPKRQPRERGELKRQSRERGEREEG